MWGFIVGPSNEFMPVPSQAQGRPISTTNATIIDHLGKRKTPFSLRTVALVVLCVAVRTAMHVAINGRPIHANRDRPNRSSTLSRILNSIVSYILGRMLSSMLSDLLHHISGCVSGRILGSMEFSSLSTPKNIHQLIVSFFIILS